MAGEFLRKKWAALFLASDLDHDGYICMKDAHIFIGRFLKYHNLQGQDAKILEKKLEELFVAVLCLEGEDKLDQNGYVEKMAAAYEKDKTAFCRRLYQICDDYSSYLDVNSDGYLSKEEHLIVLKCSGFDSFDDDYVNMYPQIKPGYVENGVYRDAWFEFYTNGDKSKINKERPVLLGFGLLDKV